MIYFLLAILVAIFGYFVLTFNKFIKLKIDVKEAFATMDVFLKKRWDLIPNIVETVKGYVANEEGTLENITKVRSGIDTYDSLSESDKIKANEEVQRGINKIMVLAENYPDLKAAENFLALQKELSTVEEDISRSRNEYNDVVAEYNDSVLMFPRNIVAGICGYREKDYFETEEEEKENIEVDL
ncbi:MAG: LemA family protein [Bacilli bacterium]|nr:LemA family protein [Bacilli bacterium]